MEQLRDTYASDSLVILAKSLGFNGEPAVMDGMNAGKDQYTLALVQKWLREIKNINTHMYHLSDTHTYGCDSYSMDSDLLTSQLLEGRVYNTYEEALEQGLREACLYLKEKQDAGEILE